MNGPVLLRSYAAPAVDRAEILRYARAAREDGALTELLDEVLAEALPTLTYRAALRELPVLAEGDRITLGPIRASSHSLAGCLGEARRALIVAATVGTGIDRLLLRYGRLSPTRALLLQAIGAERVEALLAALTADLRKKYGRLTRRFSPGYGDLPLSLQGELLPLLDPERLLGLTLCDSYLMSPSKSVTAIIGILD